MDVNRLSGITVVMILTLALKGAKYQLPSDRLNEPEVYHLLSLGL